MSPRRVVRREAHGKINVFLRVLGAREDGYHDLESLVLPVALADVVTVRAARSLKVDVQGAAELAGSVPAGGLNLALVAALALAGVSGASRGATIRIDKRIPVAGGLAGGSADAAATLSALNELWRCGLEEPTLADIAARVGSDVPAMLAGGPVLMHGRGERTAPATVSTLWWVMVTLGFGIRSPDAYRWWDEDGSPTGPDPQPLLDAAEAGDAGALGPLLFNDLEPPVFARHREIARAKDSLLAAGALGAVMSGSGSSVGGLARDREHAERIAEFLPGAIVTFGPPATSG
ncbi:MAG TPA: 4-(cytidine 5'-diphospho)-2-C-methyl-D-erythritol kinase [Actinomycetota bacterium]|jgi:4-diphosphocytidyl-2-C-methyl-D-erythritol kinase|nr:4-(cytidine 5'-diphospho)-2-C-methyl-D-erythritol kinase [Actinomycetota bacterium]